MNVSNEDIAELFRFFATMKGDIDQYRDTHTVRIEPTSFATIVAAL
jgi:hypothetical protein